MTLSHRNQRRLWHAGTLARSETLYYTVPIDMYLEEPQF